MSVISADILNDPNKDNQFSALLDAVQRLDARVAELRATASLKAENLLDVTKKPQARRNIGIPDGGAVDDVLKWDGSQWSSGTSFSAVDICNILSGLDETLNRQNFTNSSTWTVPAGATYCIAALVGGGAGGMDGVATTYYVASSSGGSPTSQLRSYGSGGGAGGSAIAYIDLTGVSSITVTVGAGGAANGGSGGSSSLVYGTKSITANGGVSNLRSGWGTGAISGSLNEVFAIGLRGGRGDSGKYDLSNAPRGGEPAFSLSSSDAGRGGNGGVSGGSSAGQDGVVYIWHNG